MTLAKLKAKYSLTIKIIPIVGVVLALKLLFHTLGWETISLNPLFSGIVAANVFLMGFLISGVLGDYKESEKLPGELVSSLSALVDEVSIIRDNGKSAAATECLEHVFGLAYAIREWFYKKERTVTLMTRLRDLNGFFRAFESSVQANFIARLKNDQSALRRLITRIHTIRETDFVASGYAVSEITTFLVCCGLVLSKIDPFYESLFFVGAISFLLIFMLTLIKELDNPFGYYEHESCEHVSLQPLEDLLKLRAELIPVAARASERPRG